MTQQRNTNDGRDQFILNQPKQVTIDNSVTSIHPSPALATTIDESVPPLTAWQKRPEEAQIAAFFAQPEIRLVGIYGAGGFGKSALAAKVYGDATGFEEKLWANFGQPKPFGTFALWLIAKAIGMERYANERELYERDSDEDLLTEALNQWADKRVLLVMDNVETLLAETMAESTGNLYQQFWQAWLNRNSCGMLLLTTQEKVQLPQAEGREWLTLKGLEVANGVTLLQGEPFRIAGDEADLRAFVEAADGHPLLLRLAASWLVARAKDDGETAEIYRLQRDDVTLFRQITAAHRGDAEATVGKVLDASFDRLKEELQLLLARASVLRGRVTEVAAQAMVAEVTLPDLRELARRSFWLERRQGEDWTFEFLPLIRRYLGLKARDMGQVENAHQKAIEFFLKTRNLVEWDTRNPATFELEDCAKELEIFHHWCELGQFAAAYDVMNTRFGGLERRGYYRELVTIYDRLTQEWEAQTPQEKENLGWAWTRLGNLYNSLGQYSSAITHHERAQNIFRNLDEKKGIAASLGSLGNAYRSLGQYQKAIDFHQQSLDIARQIGDRNGEAASLGNLGNAYNSLGQYQKAIDFHQPSLDIARQIGDRNGEAASLSSLGNVYDSLGQYQKAIDFYQPSLDIARKIGDRNGEAVSLGNLGNAYNSLGQYQKAIDFQQQSLDIDRQIGDRGGEAASLGNLGNAYNSLGQYQKAIDFHQKHYEIACKIGDRGGEAASLGNLGNAYQCLGQYQTAIDFHQKHYEIAREISDRKGEANSLSGLGNAYNSLGQYQKAIDFHQQSLDIAREIGNRNGEATSLMNLGIAYGSLGQYERALEFHQQSLEIKREIGDRNGEATSLMNLGIAYGSLGQYERALEFHQQSLEIKREIGDPRGEANSLGNLGNAYGSLGQYERALDFHLQSLDIKREIGDRNGEANSLSGLGNAYQSLGQYERAIDFYRQSLEIKREIGNRNGEAQSLQSLAVLYQHCGRIQEGFTAAYAAQIILQELELPLEAWMLPKWMKKIAKFAQRGKWHFVLCFIAGVFAFPFFLMFIVAITLWRLILGRFHR